MNSLNDRAPVAWDLGPFSRGTAVFDEAEAMRRYIDGRGVRRQPVLIDVGAHDGDLLADFATAGWAVHAIEPDPSNRAESHRVAHTVETVRLDSVLDERGIDHVDHLRVGTEGFDLFALKSYAWDRDIPDSIDCEFADRKTVPLGYSADDLASFLVGSGYVILVSEWHPVDRHGATHDFRGLRRFVPGTIPSDSWGKFLALRSEEEAGDFINSARSVGVAANRQNVRAAASRPLVSVVTPSYNQADFLRRTLDSVAAQKSVRLEHLIIDGGSNDESPVIMGEYFRANSSKHAIKMRVQRDDGQVDAINQGIAEAQGDYICWLNSDDWFVDPYVLARAVEFLEGNPCIEVAYGEGAYVDPDGAILSRAYARPQVDDLFDDLRNAVGFLQPATLFRADSLRAVGGLDPAYNLTLDYDLWIRLSKQGFRFKRTDSDWARATIHQDSKTKGSRLPQLLETVELLIDHYGEVRDVWLERLAVTAETGADGIVEQEALSASQTSALVRRYREALNRPGGLRKLVTAQPDPESENTSTLVVPSSCSDQAATNHGRARIVTTSDAPYFPQALTLIASLHRYSLDCFDEIHLFDLGLTSAQRDALADLDRVVVCQYETIEVGADTHSTKPKNYVYKCHAMDEAIDQASDDQEVLWLDAGMTMLRSIRPVVEHVRSYGAFFVDHDDRPGWPLLNVQTTHPRCCEEMNVTLEELLAPHLCSCFMGVRKGSHFEALFRDAAVAARNEAIGVWPKHLDREQIAEEARKPYVANLDASLLRHELGSDGSVQELQALTAYFGHRQDQTIYSILAARYGVGLQSGRIFARGSLLSSQRSKANWADHDGAISLASATDFTDQDESVVGYHDRGLVTNHDGLRFRSLKIPDREPEVLVLGNGPSLRGFEFWNSTLPTLGMNAAYRRWEELGWYPDLYACLDPIVAESHAEAISEMVVGGRVKRFFLHPVLRSRIADCASIEWLDDAVHRYPSLDVAPVTTGSHAALWAASLGFERVTVAGVDCFYGAVPEVRGEAGTHTLEVLSDPSRNANYFFDGYQQAGDLFQIPEPHEGLHGRAWASALYALEGSGVLVQAVPGHSAWPGFVPRNDSRRGIGVFGFAHLNRRLADDNDEQSRNYVSQSQLLSRVSAAVGGPWSAEALERLVHNAERGLASTGIVGRALVAAFSDHADRHVEVQRWLARQRSRGAPTVALHVDTETNSVRVSRTANARLATDGFTLGLRCSSPDDIEHLVSAARSPEFEEAVSG